MSSMTDVREALIAALKGLGDKDAPLDIERAKAISEVAQTLINSAKVEVEYLRTIGATQGSGFIELPEPEQRPGVRVIQHRIR